MHHGSIGAAGDIGRTSTKPRNSLASFGDARGLLAGPYPAELRGLRRLGEAPQAAQPLPEACPAKVGNWKPTWPACEWARANAGAIAASGAR